MTKISTFEELRSLRERCREEAGKDQDRVRINVSLATCSIAAGGNRAYAAIEEELGRLKMDEVILRKSGCMCFCYAEPTVEVTLPGQEPLVFGEVDQEKARLIVSSYVKEGEPVAGVIEADFDRVIL